MKAPFFNNQIKLKMKPKFNYLVSWTPKSIGNQSESLESNMKDAIKVMHELFRDGYSFVSIKKIPVA